MRRRLWLWAIRWHPIIGAPFGWLPFTVLRWLAREDV